MIIKQKNVSKSINRKFIKPLNDGCDYNILKLDREKKVKHNETISLLKQANQTLKNVDYNLKAYNLVDANVLLRAAFEYIMMGMMIQFDEGVYNEFTTLGIVRDKTRLCEIIDKFRTHLNEICEPIFKCINRKEKLSLLTDLYDKMCNFTHSTLIVTTFIEINSENEKKIFQLLIYQNYHFLKMLLFLCLKYFTNDQKHYLELNNIGFTFLFLMIEIAEKIQKYKIDFSKYDDLLYRDKNIGFFEKNKVEGEKLCLEIKKFNEDIQKESDDFKKGLEDFLK